MDKELQEAITWNQNVAIALFIGFKPLGDDMWDTFGTYDWTVGRKLNTKHLKFDIHERAIRYGVSTIKDHPDLEVKHVKFLPNKALVIYYLKSREGKRISERTVIKKLKGYYRTDHYLALKQLAIHWLTHYHEIYP